MANFKTWIETTRAGNYLVRHRDGETKLPNGRWKVFTDYCVEKTQVMVDDGKKLVGKRVAESLAETVKEKYYTNEKGHCDLSVPVQPLIDQYLTECENNGLEWMTYEHYEDVLNKITKRHGIFTISDLCTKLSDYKEKASLTLKKSTIAGEMVIVFVFCRWLIDHGHMKKWPFKTKMIPTVKRGDPKFYTESEWNALKAKLTDPMARLSCYLAYYAGLRKIEIAGDDRGRMGVLWEDLSWHPDGSVDLHVRGKVAKGGKMARTIQLDPDIVELLGSRKSGPIITLERDRLWYLFEQARRRAGINPKLTIHGLRHSFAKNCLEHGNLDLSSVQKLMGHSSITTTQIYAHHEKSHLSEGIRRVHSERKLREALAGQLQGENIKVVALTNTNMDQYAPQSSKGSI